MTLVNATANTCAFYNGKFRGKLIKVSTSQLSVSILSSTICYRNINTSFLLKYQIQALFCLALSKFTRVSFLPFYTHVISIVAEHWLLLSSPHISFYLIKCLSVSFFVQFTEMWRWFGGKSSALWYGSGNRLLDPPRIVANLTRHSVFREVWPITSIFENQLTLQYTYLSQSWHPLWWLCTKVELFCVTQRRSSVKGFFWQDHKLLITYFCNFTQSKTSSSKPPGHTAIRP